MDLSKIIKVLESVHYKTQQIAERKVNQALTLRNWLFGYYLREFEFQGEQRAEYGADQLNTIVKHFTDKNIKGISRASLYRFMQFYDYYPHIFQPLAEHLNWESDDKMQIVSTLSRLLQDDNNQDVRKVATVSRKFNPTSGIEPNVLISRLNFSHFLELIKVDNPTQRQFYELSAIKENWSVRELRRAIDTMMYERSGLTQNPSLPENTNQDFTSPASLIRNPLILEFLNLPEKPEFSEGDLEQAIINDLQNFLMELGRGFCFEARQKRITFDNTHYYIDLVFYHRILKCHVLIDLKLGAFTHADAGQMNHYLNYYKENEKEQGDNPPVGIVLCADKNDSLVHYATGGLSQELFVTKYKLQLPSEEQLKALIKEETEKLNRTL